MSSNANHKLRLSVMKAGQRGKVTNREVTWASFCKKLEEVHRDPQHTHLQYLALSVDEKNKAKDVGSYVLGQFDNNIRKAVNLKQRTAISLDIDSASREQIEWFKLGLSDLMIYEMVGHSTRSNTIMKPKLRLIIPLKEPVPIEYFMALSRIVASMLFDTVEESMDAVDDVSHRAAQIMYWPSASKDGDFWFVHNPGKLLDYKEVLAAYPGWEDWSKLPMGTRAVPRPGQNGPAERPRLKQGLVGEFCRAYDVVTAMETFIPGVYVDPKKEGRDLRYNYAAGHGSKGAVVYDGGDFLYSYHGTDPCGERNVNAFDMVRLHLFGSMDKADDEDVKSMGQQPSWKAMIALVAKDKRVQQEALKSRLDTGAMFENLDGPEPALTAIVPVSPAGRVDPVLVPADWDEELLGPPPVLATSPAVEAPDWDEELLGPPPARVQAVAAPVPGRPAHDPILEGDYDEILDAPKSKGPPEWLEELDLTDKREIKNTLANINVILMNDKRIKGAIAFNSFTDEVVLRKPMMLNHSTSLRIPVRDLSRGDQWETHHDANLRTILEAGHGENRVGYGMKVSARDLTDSVLMVARTQAFHPVKDIWESIEWDGHGRVETLLTDYLGCEDNEYHRDVARNMMLAMVTRVYEPGHKFDFTAILEGGQGIGKSTFLRKLSMGFFAEMNNDFDDEKKSVETMRGALIVEMPELQQFNRADVTAIKGFMSKSFDKVRMSYERRETIFQRRCVFWGSTNEDTYLRDTTGNRRFWPVKTDIAQIDNPRLEQNVPQLYAEALSMYRQMRTVQPYGDLPLDLRGKALKQALVFQDSRRVETDEDAKVGMIESWLDKPVRRAISTGEESIPGAFDLLSDTGEEVPHETVQRDTVCLLDVFVDCLGGTRETYKQSEARGVGNAFKQIKGWIEIGRKYVPRWGRQRVYGRVGSPAAQQALRELRK